MDRYRREMAKITYIEHDGREHTVEVKTGLSVMEGAVRNNVPGIDADCGGACACATCHVYVDEAFAAETGRPSAMEESMLDFADNVQPNSRLSCQIRVTDDLDGLIVRLPEAERGLTQLPGLLIDTPLGAVPLSRTSVASTLAAP
jgi:2Fe-2S ferredoxin